MYNIISNDTHMTIPFYSSTLEGLCDELFDESLKEDIPLNNYSIECIEELINIKNQKELLEETFKLIDFLDLNYLLYNYDVLINTTNPYIIELYTIKQLEYTETERKLHKLINYFGNNMKHVVFDYDIIDVDVVCYYGYINILDWFIKNNLELKYTVQAINWACDKKHINILEWFFFNNKITGEEYIKLKIKYFN